jgi:hypothetical protein
VGNSFKDAFLVYKEKYGSDDRKALRAAIADTENIDDQDYQDYMNKKRRRVEGEVIQEEEYVR